MLLKPTLKPNSGHVCGSQNLQLDEKVVILAGGYGTRLSEETVLKAQTNGRNWRNTYSLAYNENLQSLWF